MKNFTLTIAVVLFAGQLSLTAALEDDMLVVMNNNSKKSGTNVKTPKISYVTNGGPLTGYMFSSETSNFDTLRVIVNGVTHAARVTNSDGWGTQHNFGSHAANLPVRMRFREAYSGKIYYNDSLSVTGQYQVFVLGFPGYTKSGMNIPAGTWVGWEDWADPASDYDFNDICFVLQGVTARATDPWGTTVNVKVPPIKSGTRITNWREENTY